MVHIDNDRWRAHIPLTRNGRYEYVVQAWRDLFASWRDEVTKKHDAGQDVTLELIEGRHLVEAAAEAAEPGNAEAFKRAIAPVKAAAEDEGQLISALMSEDLRRLMAAAEIGRAHV